MIGCSWIYSKFQKRSYKREIRSRHSYVLLAMLLAKEEKLRCNISKCNEDGTGEVYLGLPQGIVKVFSIGSDKFAISLVCAVTINDIHADKARECCKELNAKESRIIALALNRLFQKQEFLLLVTLRKMETMKLPNTIFLVMPRHI